MATKEKPVENEELNINDPTTVVIKQKPEGYKGPTVPIFLPKLEEEGNGIKVDQFEHVTLANEQKETRWLIKRGEHVEVPVPVFVILKDRYPNL